MKLITITIEGIIKMCEYCSLSIFEQYDDMYYSLYENEGGDYLFDDKCDMVNGWSGIKAIFVHENNIKDDRNLIDEIGGVHTIDNYFHTLFASNGDHPLPVDLHVAETIDNQKLKYIIEIDDDDVFDIKKVQLVYSHNEIAPLKDFILAEKILYEGKEIDVENSHDEYSHYVIGSGNFYEQYEVEDFL